jgi:hypothetical protein
VKQNSLGVFAKLLAGLKGSGPVSDGHGTELRGEAPGEAAEAEAAPEGAVSRKGKTGAAKKTAPWDVSKMTLSAEHEKIQKKIIPKEAASAGAEEDRPLMAALQGVFPGKSLPGGPEAEPPEGDLSPEELLLAGAASGEGAWEGIDGGELLPEIPEAPPHDADPRDGDGARADASGEARTKLRLKDQGAAAAEGPGDPADPLLAAESGRSNLSRTVKPVSPEAKDRGPVSDPRNGKKERERLSLEVRDFRSGPDPGVRVSQESRAAGEPAGRGEAEFTVELRPGAGIPEKFSPGGEGPSSQIFTDMLARELNQTLNGDIVRYASIMLRDGGEGTIRLSLKPESLGTVKIRLEMAENKIAGQIIVESDEALRAFEREIRSLEQAFKDSGFEGASLEMALAGEGGQSGADRQWKGEEARPFFSPRLAASNYDAAGETAGYAEPDIPLDGFAAGRIAGGAAGRKSVLPQVNMLV